MEEGSIFFSPPGRFRTFRINGLITPPINRTLIVGREMCFSEQWTM